MDKKEFKKLSRRELIRMSLMAGGAVIIGASQRAWGLADLTSGSCTDQTPTSIENVAVTGCNVNAEPFPTSPFIQEPFTQEMPIPMAMRPGWRQPDGTLTPSATNAWTVRDSYYGRNVICRPGPGIGLQDTMGGRPRTCGAGGAWAPDAGTHQLWVDGKGAAANKQRGFPLANPVLYHIRLQVNQHRFTTSPVLPIDANWNPILPPGGVVQNNGKYYLPPSTIYGFNGTFPGPRINAMYGQPALVRFENDLDMNPQCLDRQDFGAPDWAFLTHLHNGHTAPESDGQPHHLSDNDGGYQPGQWVDNLYLNYPAGGDPAEMQSFLWFHDHRMHHTGPNVYKGMVGLFPIYDPKLDPGDETSGLHLPGRKVANSDGTFDVKYDIPMALYDCALDDGVTEHRDEHTPLEKCGQPHAEWWGQLFHKHYPNHGFVGDIFTVNGAAFPTLHVYRRKYRLRFLGASLARIYEMQLMTSTSGPVPANKAAGGINNFGQILQGQWQLPDGQQCMKWTQIASEGGLLPAPIVRDSFQIWPAKRREFIVDFTKYKDGTPTTPGDVIYLVNTLVMANGRKPSFTNTTVDDAGNTVPDPNFNPLYRVPMIKIIIGGAPPEPDVSVIPKTLRPMPAIPTNLKGLPTRNFTLQRSGLLGETEWVINGMQFDPLSPLAVTRRSGAGEVWTVQNGGGGWVHPMHMHMEEHHVVSRSHSLNQHPDDTGKEDVVALDPSEAVTFYRQFRTFLGNYVAHCHNLAHEDHNMMFGWSITP